MLKKLFITLVLVLLLSLMTSGCSKKEVAPDEDTFVIGITIQSLENSYWSGVFGEVEKLMQAKGWEYTLLSCNDNPAVQTEQIESFTASRVDLIMVHPSDPDAIEESLKEAREAGIKVMSWDDILVNSDVNWVLDNTQLGYTIGETAAEFIIEHYSEDNKAHVAVMNYPQTPILLERENGILTALEESAGGKYVIADRKPAIEVSDALKNMDEILEADPEVKIVCSIGAGGNIGANQYFVIATEGNIPDDMGVFSADSTERQLETIVNGEATRAIVGFEGSNKKTAEAAVDLFGRLLNDERFSARNIVRPLIVIDSANAAEYLADFQQ